MYVYLDCRGEREGEYHSEWKAESGEGALRKGEGEGTMEGALRKGNGDGVAVPTLPWEVLRRGFGKAGGGIEFWMVEDFADFLGEWCSDS